MPNFYKYSLFSILLLTAALTASSGTWTDAAPLNVPRQYPGLARLPDGRILAASGHPVAGKSLDSAEIYDPKTDSWAPTGPLNTARNGVAPGGLVMLQTGKVLLAGGGTDLRSAHEAELFDPATGTWAATGSMHEARDIHSTTLLNDGKVLVVGGIDWTTNEVRASAELYDPATGTWSTTGPPSAKRTSHCAVLLADGQVLILGGASESDVAGELARVEIYDPKTGTFHDSAPMRVARRAFRAVRLPDGRVLAIGGAKGGGNRAGDQLDSVEIFNPKTETWAAASHLLEGRWGPDAILLADGKVLASGGMFGQFGRRKSAELYDPATNAWSSAGEMHYPRNGHRSIALDDDRVLIVGGFYAGTELTACEIYHR